MSYLYLIIGAIFVNNFILAQFLGICHFLGVSKKTDSALGMGVAVIFVMGVASSISLILYAFLYVIFLAININRLFLSIFTSI